MVRVRYKHSASVFVALTRWPQVCLLRRKSTGWMDGSFSLPAGGLDEGETIAFAARREAEDEIGVRISPADLLYAHALHYWTDGSDWVGHFFTCDHWVGNPRLCEPDKHSDLTWCSIRELPDETIPYVRQALVCIEGSVP